MRIKILLDNDLATDGFMVFYLIYDNLTPFFEIDTDKSTTPPTFYKICNLGIRFKRSVKG